MWKLTQIAVYPIKSLDPVWVEQAEVLPSGALSGDRQFALYDQKDKIINAKKFPTIQQIRAEFDLTQQAVMLSTSAPEENRQSFHLVEQIRELENWFSDYFNQPVSLKENLTTGFPDDLEASGPTMISTQTYQELNRWFPEISVEELRLRFRANLEFDGDTPFCEDRLYSADSPPVLFQTGSVIWSGSNPCKRCVVPSRNPWTAETDNEFMKTFIQKRKATFPEWAPLELFQNMYRLAVNTHLHQLPAPDVCRIKVGDSLTILN